MAIQIEIVLIVGIAAVALIVVGKAMMIGFAISRRPSHHLADKTGASSVPPAVDIRPPE